MSCGAEKLKFLINPPNFIFKKSCLKHDKNYQNKKGKFKADFEFLKNMFVNVKNDNSNIFTKLFLYFVALFYFFQVLVFGYIFYSGAKKYLLSLVLLFSLILNLWFVKFYFVEQNLNIPFIEYKIEKMDNEIYIDFYDNGLIIEKSIFEEKDFKEFGFIHLNINSSIYNLLSSN